MVCSNTLLKGDSVSMHCYTSRGLGAFYVITIASFARLCMEELSIPVLCIY